MSAITIYLDDDTQKRLAAISSETAMEVTELAEGAVREAALNYYKRHADDPARKARAVATG